MPVWKYGQKNITKEDAENSVAAVKNACFHCETHGSDCPISRTAGEIRSVMEEDI